MKIAFDENLPIQMVRVFQAFASEKQLKKLTGDFDVTSAKEYTPKPGDADYTPKNDVPWLKRFAEDGGKIVISGDTKMRYVPHERKALIDHGFVVIFFEGQWSKWTFFPKCALLLHWWPVVAKKIKSARPGFWTIPCNWKENGRLRKLSMEDPRALKLEQRKASERKRKAAEKAAQVAEQKAHSDGPLFDYAKPKKPKSKRRKNDAKAAEGGTTAG